MTRTSRLSHRQAVAVRVLEAAPATVPQLAARMTELGVTTNENGAARTACSLVARGVAYRQRRRPVVYALTGYEQLECFA